MNRVWFFGIVLSACAVSAQASDLNVRTLSGGGPLARVGPGATVPYVVEGELSDNASAGLALFTFDLAFSGGPLVPTGVPTSAPMDSFNTPKGFVNPAGFGGTLVGGVLRQVGGGQNTINNTFAPTPNGTVIQNVGQLGSPAILCAGQLTAPYAPGTYTLVPSAVQANVLDTQSTTPSYWKVLPAGVGSVSPLTVDVRAVRLSRTTVRPSAGESVTIVISAGPANAGRTYKMVGCWSGTAPGVPLPGGMTLPLNNDRYLEYTTAFPNGPILSNSQGTLDANGRGTVTFHPTTRFEGLTISHAFYLVGPTDFVSEPESVLVIP